MTGTGSPTPGRALKRWLGGTLVVLLIAAGAVAWQTGHAQLWWDRWFGETADPGNPAAVAPPPEVEIPPVTAPKPVAPPARARPALDVAAVEQSLRRRLADPDLGGHVLAAVAPLRGNAPGYRQATGAELAVPASTAKVVTAAVALYVLGGDHRFTTRTVLESGGDVPEVVLVGGGDPYLTSKPHQPGSSATFELRRQSAVKLANRTAQRLKQQGTTRIRLEYDASLFTGPVGHPTWQEDPKLEVGAYLKDEVVAPISALWIDQGHPVDGTGREPDPPRAAAQFLAAELRKRGIDVELGGATVASAGAQPLVSLASAPLAHIVQRLLEVSDNSAAETLLRHIGLAVEGEGSFAAGQRGVRRTLAAAGIQLGDSVLYDGSGLSRANRMTPQVLIDVIRWVADPQQPALRPVLSSLPVAGFTGSLTNRMDEAPAAGLGRIRAKTGTLTGVASLAGIAVDLDGNLMAFVLMADRVPEDRDTKAQTAIDNAAAALGACHCGG